MIIPSKHDGYGEGGRVTSTRRVFDSGPSSPSKTTQVADLPSWAKPAAQRVLGKAEALTDINKNPYQAYEGQRVADFSPLQQQAFDRTSKMDAGPEAFGQQVGQYMSPYIQNVINAEKLEAARVSQMQGQQQQAQAAQAGAFGGYREAIQRAERERGLAQQLGDIQTKGLQSAYDRASDQFRQGIGQNMAITQQMGQMGGLQQAREQQLLSNQYQDFQNQQRYPYQQLEFMSNILRGTPMGTVNTMYTPGATSGQMLGSLGMGLYGLSQLGRGFAEGGAVGGDDSVTGERFVEQAIRRLSDAQLQQEMQDAAQEGDKGKLSLLEQEASRRAQVRGSANAGISSAFTDQMADQVLPTEESMARGGIVAFAGNGPSLVSDSDDEEEGSDSLAGLAALAPTQGNASVYNKVTSLFPTLLSQVAGSKYTPMTSEEYNKAISDRRAMLEEAGGKSPYADMRAQIEQMRGERDDNLAQGRGLAALQAAAAMMEGRGFVQGLAKAGGAFGQSYGQALAADRAEKKSLANMEFNLADAERKERMGLTRDAIAAADQARKDHDAAQMYKLKKATALASMTSKMASATKPVGGKPPAPAKGFDALAEAEYAGLVAGGEKPGAETRRMAYRNAANIWGKQPGEERTAGTMAGVTSKIDLKVIDAVNKARFTPEYIEAKTDEERDAVLERAAAGVRRQVQTQTGSAKGPAVNNNSTPKVNPAKVEGLPPGAEVRGNEVYQNGKLIGHVR